MSQGTSDKAISHETSDQALAQKVKDPLKNYSE